MPEQDKVTYDGLSAVRAVRPRLLLVLVAAVTLAALAVVLVISTRANVRAEPVPVPPATTVSPTSNASPTPELTVRATPSPALEGNDDEEVASSAVAARIAPVAVRFTDAWLRPGTEASRLAALRPVSTLALARALSKVDPNRLPTGARLGTPEVLAASAFDVRVRQALGDGSSILLDLVPEVSLAGSRWLVTSVRPGEPG